MMYKDSNGKIIAKPLKAVVDGVEIHAPSDEMLAKIGIVPYVPPTPEPPPTSPIVYISKAKVEAVIDEIGKTAAFVAWLNSKAAYFGAWMRGGDMIEYDPTAHGGDLASLIAAIGIAEADVAALIEKVVAA